VFLCRRGPGCVSAKKQRLIEATDSACVARYCRRLPVRRTRLDLPQQSYNLLRCLLPASCHSRLLSFQFLSLQLVQMVTGTPLNPVRIPLNGFTQIECPGSSSSRLVNAGTSARLRFLLAVWVDDGRHPIPQRSVHGGSGPGLGRAGARGIQFDGARLPCAGFSA
jgi:hypothetical protein